MSSFANTIVQPSEHLRAQNALNLLKQQGKRLKAERTLAEVHQLAAYDEIIQNNRQTIFSKEQDALAYFKGYQTIDMDDFKNLDDLDFNPSDKTKISTERELIFLQPTNNFKKQVPLSMSQSYAHEVERLNCEKRNATLNSGKWNTSNKSSVFCNGPDGPTECVINSNII